MKRRTGLVSNSSSSSFLLFLDKAPESEEEVKEVFFPNDEVFGNPYTWGNEPRGWPIEQVVKTIYNDLKDQDPLTEEEILEELCSGWLREVRPSWDPWGREAEKEIGEFPRNGTEEEKEAWRDRHNVLYEKYDKEQKELARKYRKTLPQGGVVFCVRYSDNKGAYFAALEHGNTFRNVKHVCISHH